MPIDTPGFEVESRTVEVRAINPRIPQTGFFSTTMTASKTTRANATIPGEVKVIAIPRSAPTIMALPSINNTYRGWSVEGFESIRNYLVTQKNKLGWNTDKIIKITGKTSASHYFSKSQWHFPTKEHYNTIRNAANGDAFYKEYDALKKEYNALKKEYYSTRAYFNNTHDNMNNVWHFDRHVRQGNEGGHATPKPIPLCERVIKSSCPEGGLVIDFFLGSDHG